MWILMEKYANAQVVFEYLFGEMWEKVIGNLLKWEGYGQHILTLFTDDSCCYSNFVLFNL